MSTNNTFELAVRGDAAVRELTELSGLSVEELRAELSRSLERTVHNLMRLALIVRTLEERGEDLTDLRLGLITYLRQIAYGQVLPEVVVRFGESPLLMRAVGSLPIPDQQKLAAGEPIELVVRDEGGRVTRRLADPLRMTRQQIRQAFASGRIRDEAEQILCLEATPRATKVSRVASKNVRPDFERGGVRIGRVFVKAADLFQALADLGGAADEDEDDEKAAIPVTLTKSEHRRVKVAAEQAGVSMSVFLRRGLIHAGLLPGKVEQP